MINPGLLAWSEISPMPVAENTHLGQNRIYWSGVILTQREAQAVAITYMCGLPPTPETKRALNVDRAKMLQCGFFEGCVTAEESYDRVAWKMSTTAYGLKEKNTTVKDVLLAIINPAAR